jgi:PAS domain S-box-containing protein
MNSGTVLVVDDTLSSLKLVTDILSAEGYQVLPANSGELALAAVALKAPQLILLDLRMPGMDGLEVLRRLKARDESRDIPVMILSAVTESQQRIEGLRLGAVDFLSKPFAREELLARVSTQVSLALVRARLEQQTARLRLSNEQLQIEMVARQRVEDALRLAKEAAEEGLEKERRLLASIVFSSQDAIISKNLDGIVTSWNRGAEKVFGYSAAEIVGQPILMLIPDERRDEEDRVLAAIRQGKSIEHYETTRIRKGGRPIGVSVTVSPIRDHQGRIIGASKIARDMSERRQMEDALREQEESFRLIAENLDGFVATLDIDGRRLYNSPSYARLLGSELFSAPYLWTTSIPVTVSESAGLSATPSPPASASISNIAS